jgi:hypothetical protein
MFKVDNVPNQANNSCTLANLPLYQHMKHTAYFPLYTQVHLLCSQAQKKNIVSSLLPKHVSEHYTYVVPSDTWAVRTRAQQSLAAWSQHASETYSVKDKKCVHIQKAMKKSRQSSK